MLLTAQLALACATNTITEVDHSQLSKCQLNLETCSALLFCAPSLSCGGLPSPRPDWSRPSAVPTTTDGSLDLSTKLRLAEAEVAILQREVAELIADRTALETQATEYRVHWVFATQTCGRLVEERDAAVAKFEVGGAGIGWVGHAMSMPHPWEVCCVGSAAVCGLLWSTGGLASR